MTNEEKLLSKIETLYEQSKDIFSLFGGPSVYFHVQAIAEQKSNFLSKRHIELIYATLASWGMHRMGDPQKTKTKIVDFELFESTITCNKDKLKQLLKYKMHECTIADYDEILNNIKPIYECLKVSASNATIVANSKALAHILPDLIPPIDRQYTIKYFNQKDHTVFENLTPVLPDGIDRQFSEFKKLCMEYKKLLGKCNLSLFIVDCNKFNTSYPKILDNIIMAYVKSEK